MSRAHHVSDRSLAAVRLQLFLPESLEDTQAVLGLLCCSSLEVLSLSASKDIVLLIDLHILWTCTVANLQQGLERRQVVIRHVP